MSDEAMDNEEGIQEGVAPGRQEGFREGMPPRRDIPDTHPPGFWFFFWGEFAERSSYYGMRAILPMYLTTVMMLPDTQAGPIYYRFKMACYFLPLLGGFLADRFFGKYWTIVGFSVPYVAGHFILGIPEHWALFLALGLLAGGSGVIKPNISTLMGLTYDQQRPGKERLRSAAFMWFYFSINVGALVSTYAMPMIRTQWSYAIAFQFPAWLMVLSLLVFASGKRYYARETIGKVEETPEEKSEKWKTLAQLFGFFGLMVLFWVPYEHNDSLWVFFLRDYVDLRIPFTSYVVPPDQLQVLNPAFVLIFVPVFNILFRLVDPKGRVFTVFTKILIGFFLTAAASGIVASAASLYQTTQRPVSMLWVAGAYIVLTAAEVLLYGTGLELAYTAAPKNMKGFVTACFLVTNTLGNFIDSFFSPLYGGSLKDAPEQRGPLAPAPFFTISASIALVAGFAWIFVGRKFNKPAHSAA
jgi:dipeptide/tripeptide permease